MSLFVGRGGCTGAGVCWNSPVHNTRVLAGPICLGRRRSDTIQGRGSLDRPRRRTATSWAVSLRTNRGNKLSTPAALHRITHMPLGGPMTFIATLSLLAISLTGTTSPDWVPLRWKAFNGPRDIEFSQPSVRLVAGVLSVSVRRDRAVLLKQDPTIAPETNPWTTMDLQINCVEATWRVVLAKATDASGKFVGSQASGSRWMAVDAGTMASALRTHLCPAA
jgi:hypothetical protein